MILADDLRGAWPPDEPEGQPEPTGYLRSRLASTVLLDALELSSDDDRRRAVAIAARPGGDLSLVPLVRVDGVWRRAGAGDGVAGALVRDLSGPAPRPPFTLRRLAGGLPGAPATARPGAAAAGGERAAERVVGVDQTNESLVVDESVVVKWIRAPALRPHRAPALLAHLVEAGFRDIPPPLGTLEWTAADGASAVLAFIDGFLPDARDGWDWCVEAVEAVVGHVGHAGHAEGGGADVCGADLGGPLGVLIARLHVSLATPTGVLPEPVARVGPATVEAWIGAARETFESALHFTDGADGSAVRERAPRMAAALAGLSDVGEALVQPTHGDLHVGQVLRWRSGHALIDFDGNPAVAEPIGPVRASATIPSSAVRLEPAVRDVAQMVRSLDHVGRVADRRTGHRHSASIERWIARSRARFLDAYRAGLADAGRADLYDDRLLVPFEVEQECRELVYAARFLPRWRYAPTAALVAMFP